MHKKDFLLILILLVIAALWWLAGPLLHGEETDIAEISVDGRKIASLPLDREGCFTFEGLAFPFTVEIREGRIHMLEAACPDKICEHTGFIRYSGQSIICLPNHVIIEMKKSEGTQLDAVLY